MSQVDANTQDLWLEVLTDGARFLEAGKIEEAALALGGLGPLCAPGAPKPSLDVAAQARELWQRCFRAEAQQRSQLVDELNHLASGQKARVYRFPAEPSR
jgi:hypothetical protein